MYLPSDSRLDLPREGTLFELDFKKWSEGRAKCGHYSSHLWAIIYVRPGALGQIWHWCKSLSNVAEYFYQIC